MHIYIVIILSFSRGPLAGIYAQRERGATLCLFGTHDHTSHVPPVKSEFCMVFMSREMICAQIYPNVCKDCSNEAHYVTHSMSRNGSST